ncbi:MAG: murein biosynthesis integral membrane protein MurJ [Nitrospirae bacterium]|nr:MAG: murein biosynthesis integral membrane protein MurJ [Nitrospirota bacterium]
MGKSKADGDSSSPHHAERTQVVEAAGIIGAATLLSRILGFLRDMVLARLFGAGAAADAFFVAYRIPNLLRELFAEGSMSAAFIPVFSEYLVKRDKRDAWELASAAFTTLLTILTGVCVLGVLAAPWLVQLIAPGFGADPERQALTVLLTRIMFPYLLFIGLAALAMGVLNSVRSFAAPAFSPVLFNIAIIASAFLLAPLFDQPILAVAAGVVLGGLAQFLIQMPAMKKAGLLFGWRFDFAHAGVRRIGWLMAPALIGLSVTQINILVSTILASYFPGGPTYLFYGMRLIHFPLGVFGVALATALLPSLAGQAAKGELEALRGTLGFGLRLIFFVIFPAMVGIILLRLPIVHLFFEHGRFTAADTQATAAAVLAYAVGLWAFAGVRIVVSAFYSLQDTRTPVKVAAAALAANVALSLALMEPLRHAGLALATAFSAILNMVLLVVLLDRRLGPFDWDAIARSHMRVLLAAIPIAVTCAWVAGLGVWAQPEAWAAKTVMLIVGIGISVTGYVTVHALLHSDELDFLWGLLKRKLARPAA